MKTKSQPNTQSEIKDIKRTLWLIFALNISILLLLISLVCLNSVNSPRTVESAPAFNEDSMLYDGEDMPTSDNGGFPEETMLNDSQ